MKKLSHRLCYPATLMLLAAAVVVGAAKPPGQKILLSQVNTLTLRDGQMTKGRRVAPVPQLKCVGGDGNGLYTVDVMRCRNSGSDYDDDDLAWTCTADVPKYFKLGSTDVFCEGYDHPDDKYILKGSCGVEYRLALTDAGYEKYGRSSFSRLAQENKGGLSSTLFWIIFACVAGWIIYAAYTNNTQGPPRAGRNPRATGRPWFGGGGGGDDDDAPPPYDPRPPRYNKPSTSTAPTSGGQWAPGFWSGLAAGAAGTYLAGNRTQERTRAAPAAGYSYGGGGGAGPSSSSGWGGGGGSSMGGESSSAGAERHSSTGFGQTRRR